MIIDIQQNRVWLRRQMNDAARTFARSGDLTGDAKLVDLARKLKAAEKRDGCEPAFKDGDTYHAW